VHVYEDWLLLVLVEKEDRNFLGMPQRGEVRSAAICITVVLLKSFVNRRGCSLRG